MNPASSKLRPSGFFHCLGDPPVFVCRLKNGLICRYSQATPLQNPPNPGADYLGEGVIHSIDGVPQLGLTVLHFWR